jgi:hypothetical protein
LRAKRAASALAETDHGLLETGAPDRNHPATRRSIPIDKDHPMQLVFAAAAALTAVILANPVSAQDGTDNAGAAMPGVVGYGHPAVGPDACKAVDPGHAQCVIPGKTAGRYLAVATGTSTAKGVGATQTLAIGGKTWRCQQIVTAPTAKWVSGPRTLHMACAIDVLSDDPVIIGVAYQDNNAEKDPKGPTLTLQPIPWDGILASRYAGAN